MSSSYSGGGAAAASPGQHSLAFRVMRLCRPSLRAEDSVLRLHPADLFAGEDLFDDPRISPSLLFPPSSTSAAATNGGDFSFRHRFHLQDPADAIALSGLLVLPQSFGAIYLGETFCSYISINNSSRFEARDVVIKAEMQTERQRILLLDTSKSPVESIRSGGRYDFIVEHDVKELGQHTLVCTALYNDGDSERKYLPQFFKFAVANPLSVRTKVRTVKDCTFLEACIENHTKSNLYMDQVEFEPAQQWTATRMEADENSSEISPKIRDIFKPPVLIRAGGGIYNYLYQLKPSSEESSQVKVDGSNILGKFQITWRTNLGEPGRLQTQNIHGTPVVHKDADLRIVELPSAVYLGKPFLVHLCLTNQVDRTLGPFEVYLAPSISGEEKAVLVNGLQKLVLPPVEAFDSVNFNLVREAIYYFVFSYRRNLVATRLGVQKISGITISAVHEKKYYEPLPDIEIFVDAE
ncbi:trafficking protein particle complex subunit 13 isoform X1 [Ananas comosus]|uniref:Trafficking protein particle complex subunit 13 isoform X1 n=1 Tax=Ananas comosus TaxID=4615 RepID=A0A6P5ENI7_ANACO|nr:trafficking protein particle complex subunit 13 isoform X1 [Ananas comosus]